MLFIGDCHGKIRQYAQIIQTPESTLQIGDMGVGFRPDISIFSINMKDRFIRGNHDDPAGCKKIRNYLGDFGYVAHLNMFYVGGAWSIDQWCRTEGVTWWRDEELSIADFQRAIDLYTKHKPSVMITHDCPENVACQMFNVTQKISTRTGQALQAMFDIHKPSIWIFGHWHLLTNKNISGCEFRCLDELSTFSIPGEW